MHLYSITLDGETIGVRSNIDLTPIFAKWEELLHLTGVTISLGGEHEFNIEYVSASGYSVNYQEKQVQIVMPARDLHKGEVLLYAVLPFLEILHQRNAVVTMHAAAVELGTGAILLLGKIGAGKTSLTLSLCRNHQARLIGNDIVNVGLQDSKVVTHSGSKYFFLRQESIKRNIPDLLSLFPQSRKDPWTHKIHCLPDRLGITTCNRPLPITRSYLVHVDETMSDVYTTSADCLDTRLYLNENMSRYIRGTATALFGGSSRPMGYIPSFDTSDFFEMRVKMMEVLISSSQITYVAGNLQNICQHFVSEAEF